MSDNSKWLHQIKTQSQTAAIVPVEKLLVLLYKKIFWVGNNAAGYHPEPVVPVIDEWNTNLVLMSGTKALLREQEVNCNLTPDDTNFGF